MIWKLDAELVEGIWRETGEVFGNKLWLDSMYGLVPRDRQEQIEQVTGLSLSGLLDQTVRDLDQTVRDLDQGLPDPSLFFAALARVLARFGVVAHFARHPRYGDVLERARMIEETGSVPAHGAEVWDFDEDMVGELWLAIEDSLDDADWVSEQFTGMLLPEWRDEATLRVRCEVDQFVAGVLCDLGDLGDPSVALIRVAEAFSRHGIDIQYGPHPESGDVVARARMILAAQGEDPDQGNGPDGEVGEEGE